MADTAPDEVPARPKVVSLRGGEIPSPGVPLPDVIAEAERILEMARSGEIVGIAAVFNHSDECTSSNYAGAIGRACIGQFELMKIEICRAILRSDGRE